MDNVAKDLRSLGVDPAYDPNRVAVIGFGSLAARPAANLIRANNFYYATDTNVLAFSDGSAWATLSGFPAAATSLPGSPSGGQLAVLTDSTTSPSWQWLMQYDSSVSGAYKWRFLGGSPAASFVDTSEATASTTYVALTTAGPSISVPAVGVYLIEIGAAMNRSSGSTSMYGIMSYDVGASAASDNDAVYGTGHDNNTTQYNSAYGLRQKTISSLPTQLTAKYRVSANTVAFHKRWMRLTPVLLG